MKILWHKIKKANKLTLSIYLIFSLLYIVCYVLFVKSLLSLVGIETTIRLIVIFCFFCWLLIYLLFGLTHIILKKYLKFGILSTITIILTILLIIISTIVNKIYSKIDSFSQDEYITYTTNLITLKDTELYDSSQLGIISNKDDIEGNVLAHTLIKKYNLNQKIVYYDDYYEMIDALYNKEIDGIFLTNNYISVFGGEENYNTIATDTIVVYEYSEKMKNKTITNTNKKLTEPFTILLMGVDSEYDGLNANAAFNGDTLMLITFNPQTLTATMFSIPRDTYVPIACNNNRYNKINSAAAYGTSCVINTIQNLTDIKIDYYAKINFNGVIDLVNTLGGIDVFVEPPDYDYYISVYGEGRLCESNSLRDMTNLVCMNTGMQHLTGEQTLAYARNRHGYILSDIARNKHQQLIIEALSKKLLTISSLNDIEKIIDTISKNIATNIQTNQILSIYNTIKNMLINTLKGNDFIKIQKTYLEYYNLNVVIPGTNYKTSAIGYYPDSLEAIKKSMKINLNLEQEEMQKTFNYDINEQYESSITGKNIKTGKILTTVPDFTGNSLEEAKVWTENNGIELLTEYICSDSIPGLIGSQNVTPGILTNNISSLTLYINQKCDTQTSPIEPSNPEEDLPNIPGLPENNNSDNPENPLEPNNQNQTDSDNNPITQESNESNDKKPENISDSQNIEE